MGALAALLVLPLAAFGRDPGAGHYEGTQYHLGGDVTAVHGPQPAVQQAASEITRSADDTLHQIAEHRRMLAHGDIASRPGPPKLVTYPGPAGITASPKYQVRLEQRHRSHDSFVYYTTAKKTDTNIEDDTSWTSFSFRGRVTVHVTPTDPSGITACIVRPTSAAIRTAYADGTCTFTLSDPGNVSVEFEPNVSNPVLHPMLVFANPLEADVPHPGDPDVLYFGPGVHDIGAQQPLRDGQTIYLAGGAWVRGTFLADGPVHDLTIRGRGVLDGSFLDTGDQTENKKQPGMVDIADQSSSNLLVEGITFANAVRFNVRALGKYTTIENVKIIDWWWSADGMVGGTPAFSRTTSSRSTTTRSSCSGATPSRGATRSGSSRTAPRS